MPAIEGPAPTLPVVSCRPKGFLGRSHQEASRRNHHYFGAIRSITENIAQAVLRSRPCRQGAFAHTSVWIVLQASRATRASELDEQLRHCFQAQVRNLGCPFKDASKAPRCFFGGLRRAGLVLRIGRGEG